MQDEYMGIIKIFAGNFAMRGFALCQGQTLAISPNTALFSILGTTYGGNGVQTFQLPDLQGRAPIGAGNGPGLTPRVLGEKSGTENVTLLISNMPAHTHVATFTPGGGGTPPTVTASLMASTQAATQNVPGTSGATTLGAPAFSANRVTQAVPAYVADSNPTVALAGLSVAISGGSTGSGTVSNAITGQSVPTPIMQPYLAINYVICIQGVFPSRN
ncbi:phage tail protein [Chitinophagaceae bacterium LWZ2-11]